MINKPLGENTGQGIHGFYVSEAVNGHSKMENYGCCAPLLAFGESSNNHLEIKAMIYTTFVPFYLSLAR
jgi:hypothetical protein